jgi:hypothetical protein
MIRLIALGAGTVKLRRNYLKVIARGTKMRRSLGYTASTIEEARRIFHRDRTDLLTIESRIEAGLDGFHLAGEEKERFFDLDEFVEKQAERELITWIWHDGRWRIASRFVDFPR